MTDSSRANEHNVASSKDSGRPRIGKLPLAILVGIPLVPAIYWSVLFHMPGSINFFYLEMGTSYEDVIRIHGEPMEKIERTSTWHTKGHYVNDNPVNPGHNMTWVMPHSNTFVKSRTFRYRNATLQFDKKGKLVDWKMEWGF